MAKQQRGHSAQQVRRFDAVPPHRRSPTFPNDGRRRLAGVLGAGLCVAVAGCAPKPPAGPTVMALPAKGEGFAPFEQHDTTCRQYATAQTGAGSAGRAAAGGAIVGTGVGTAAGALVGSVSGHAGAGAAIGAGSGLLAGGLLGSARGRRSAASAQNRYNMSYTACMIANGEDIAPPAPPIYVAPYPSALYVPTPAEP